MTYYCRSRLDFKSCYYDTETGFYYLQTRYYDPAIGRFINADSFASTGQGFLGYNMFAYCGNNPISYQDSNGNAAKISFNDSTDVLKMPWESAGGGGGVNLSAAGYLVLGGLKYSQNDDAREIFAIVEDVLFAQNADDFHILTSHIMDFVTDSELVESTEPIYKINKGRKKVQQGEVYLLSPYSSPVKRIYGGYLIIYGNFLIIQGVVSGLVEVHDDRI